MRYKTFANILTKKFGRLQKSLYFCTAFQEVRKKQMQIGGTLCECFLK